MRESTLARSRFALTTTPRPRCLWLALVLLTGCSEHGPIDPPEVVAVDQSASWHPSGDSLLLVRSIVGGQIELMKFDLPDGPLTSVAPGAWSEVRWSPEGDVVVGAAGGVIYRISDEGGEALTPPGVRAYNFAWMNDSTILYSSDESDDGFSLWQMDVGSKARDALWPNLLPTGEVDVSPGGNFAVVVTLYPPDDLSPSTRLYSLNLATGDTAFITPASHAVRWPRIHPDGTKVAYVRIRGADLSIWSVDLQTGAVEELIDDAFDPAFSPDGNSIVFSRRSEERVRLWIADSDGADERPLTDPLTTEAVQ